MATLAPDSRPSSPSPRRRSRWARRCERCCCMTLTYFPLVFVYGITSWAVWVQVSIGLLPQRSSWTGFPLSILGVALFLLLNWSYTVAVFVDPGPTFSSSGYSHLPTQEPPTLTAFTVKSTGDTRFCKKCQARKPDRAHHCSTCKRCVLKMDHHCPWLATCVGLRNYKAFVLFLTYTTLFCGVCFAISAHWIWSEILSDGQYKDTLMPINNIMLAAISGIIGLALAGFTGWHISLAWRNQTTIECLEKTRYLSPLRKSMQQQKFPINTASDHSIQSYGQQLREMHVNALPGVTRPEEGEERSSPVARDRTSSPLSSAQASLHRNYNDLEQLRERRRYEEYLDEQDSDKLPHAFDLGWRRNLQHLFGEKPSLWFFPICNTTGDGWNWEASAKWIQARDEIRGERERQRAQEQSHELYASGNHQGVQGREDALDSGDRHYLAATDMEARVSMDRSSSSRDDMRLQTLRIRDGIDLASDSVTPPHPGRQVKLGQGRANLREWDDWAGHSPSRSPQPGSALKDD